MLDQHRVGAELKPAALGTGEDEEVLDEAMEPLGLGTDIGRDLAPGLL